MGNIAVKWTGEGSQMFIGRDSFGHVVVAGSWPSDDPEWQEWKGLKPSDLLLIGLAACSAYDVVMILKRQRQKLINLSVNADGQQLSDPPYQFTNIHMHYIVEGQDLNRQKIERAITLSEEKYCSVAATVKGVANLTHSFEIVAGETAQEAQR
jgi:putative redox protein